MSHTHYQHERMAAKARQRALTLLAARHPREFEILLDGERLDVDLPPVDSKAPCPDCSDRRHPRPTDRYRVRQVSHQRS